MLKLTHLDISNNRISNFSAIAGLIENLVDYDDTNRTLPPRKSEDVNRDGVVNITDLVFAASNFGNPDLEALAQKNNYQDVNNDGEVNIIALLLVVV